MVSKVKIKIKDLYKIFGPKGESHVERVKSGVGKTELAKSIAEFIFGDENNCIRIVQKGNDP